MVGKDCTGLAEGFALVVFFLGLNSDKQGEQAHGGQTRQIHAKEQKSLLVNDLERKKYSGLTLRSVFSNLEYGGGPDLKPSYRKSAKSWNGAFPYPV